MSRHVSNDLKHRARLLATKLGIPYSAALARLRAPKTQTAPRRTVEMTTYLYVDFPLPQLAGTTPCQDCAGSALSGLSGALESGGDNPPLLIEGICGACGGCGRADHDTCPPLHADDDPDEAREYLEELSDESEDGTDPCPSCGGREFSYVQAFTTDQSGDLVDGIILRTPCGCTADRARTITGEPVEVSA